MRLLITVALFGAVSASCRPSQSQESNRNKCYFLADNPLHYNESEVLCQRYGGRLASIANAFEQPLISQAAQNGGILTSANVWIGLRKYPNGQFVWDDGTPYTFNNFGPVPGDGDCVIFSLGSRQWSLNNCQSTHAAICITDAVEPPKPTCLPADSAPRCDEGWRYFDGSCYKVYRNGDYHYFEKICSSQAPRSRLVSIHSEEENHFVTSLSMDDIKGTTTDQTQFQVFIGLERDENDGFHNHDGTPVDFTTWAEGKPSDRSNKCVEILTVPLTKNEPSGRYKSFWNDVSCDSIRSAVCKQPSKY